MTNQRISKKDLDRQLEIYTQNCKELGVLKERPGGLLEGVTLHYGSKTNGIIYRLTSGWGNGKPPFGDQRLGRTLSEAHATMVAYNDVLRDVVNRTTDATMLTYIDHEPVTVKVLGDSVPASDAALEAERIEKANREHARIYG